MLSGVWAARRTRLKPPERITSVSRFSPACAPSASPVFLRQRGRNADHRRGRVVEPPDRVDVVLQRVAGHRARPPSRCRPSSAPCGYAPPRPSGSPMSCRQSKQVIRSKSRPAKSCARPTSKLTFVNAVRPGMRGRGGDRAGMEIVAGELRVRERLRHQDRRQPVAAADVGHLRARSSACRRRRRAPAATPAPAHSRSPAGTAAPRRRTCSRPARPRRRPCRS